MNFYGKVAVAAVAVVAIGAIGSAILRPTGAAPAGTNAGGQVSPSPSVASPSPSALALSGSELSFVLPDPDSPNNGALLQPGTWRLSAGFPVSIAFDVPDGWAACSASPVEQGLCAPQVNDAANSAGVPFSIIENVVSDPCGADLKRPPVGRSVDDLVTAISHLKGFQVTAPIDLAVDEYRGTQITVTAPASARCELHTWATADRTNGVGLGEANVLQIVDVDGVRVLIAGAYSPTTSASTRAQLDAILASVQITK
jgi:hypothetical protein